MKIIQAVLLLGFCLPPVALASTIHVEPDDFPNLSTITVDGVTLTLADIDDQIRPDWSIVSLTQFGFPSTGHSFFGPRGPGGFTGLFFLNAQLRADFASLMQVVSIDFIGCCDVPGHPLTIGILRAFDTSGAVIGSYTTAPLLRNEVETGTIALPNAEIAYILASIRDDSNATSLDNLIASVPEPDNVVLLGAGIALFGVMRRMLRVGR
jgi:hypothetical protein